MATRKSMQEAQELTTELQTRHPNATLRIIDNSETMQIGRKAAERQGFEVTEDGGGCMVTAKVTAFDVMEVRKCKCGKEILTIAIGEWSLDECSKCRAKRQARQEKESRERREIQAQKVAEAEWRDRWEEGEFV